MIVTIITAVVALALGALAGFYYFRHIAKGKYNEILDTAQKDADVIKEKNFLRSRRNS